MKNKVKFEKVTNKVSIHVEHGGDFAYICYLPKHKHHLNRSDALYVYIWEEELHEIIKVDNCKTRATIFRSFFSDLDEKDKYVIVFAKTSVLAKKIYKEHSRFYSEEFYDWDVSNKNIVRSAKQIKAIIVESQGFEE